MSWRNDKEKKYQKLKDGIHENSLYNSALFTSTRGFYDFISNVVKAAALNKTLNDGRYDPCSPNVMYTLDPLTLSKIVMGV